MTVPFHRPTQCPACGGRNGIHDPGCPRATPPSPDMRTLLAAYVDLRRECIGLEELIAHSSEPGNGTLTADDLKRLDKAMTVMKVGFKMVKKVLRTHDVAGTGSWREVESANTGGE